MNAYELKDVVEWQGEMIKEQADRIAELEKLNEEMAELCEQQLSKKADRIAELEKDIELLSAINETTQKALLQAKKFMETNAEPVAWVDKIWMQRPDLVMTNDLQIGKLFMRCGEGIKNYVPLYITPQTKLLSNDVIWAYAHLNKVSGDVVEFTRAIEAKIRGEA